jgi:hypothetical protein
MGDALNKVTAADVATKTAQDAVNGLSVDDCPNRQVIADHLTAAYAEIAKAQQLLQG